MAEDDSRLKDYIDAASKACDGLYVIRDHIAPCRGDFFRIRESAAGYQKYFLLEMINFLKCALDDCFSRMRSFGIDFKDEASRPKQGVYTVVRLEDGSEFLCSDSDCPY